MNNEELWGKFLDIIEENLSTVSFDLWFKHLVFVDFNDNTLTFSVINDYYRNHINKYFGELLDEVCEKVADHPISYEIVLPNEILNKKEEPKEKEDK